MDDGLWIISLSTNCQPSTVNVICQLELLNADEDKKIIASVPLYFSFSFIRAQCAEATIGS